MQRSRIISVVHDINKKDLLEISGSIDDYLKGVLEDASNNLDFTFENLQQYFPSLSQYNVEKSCIWNYICIHIYALYLLKASFEDTPSEDVLSVEDSFKLNQTIEKFIGVGIRPNLLTCMPTFRQLTGKHTEDELLDIETIKYNRLIVMTLSLLDICKCEKLRNCIYSNLKVLLAGLYQLMYCPLKKPNTLDNSQTSKCSYIMTTEAHEKLLKDRNIILNEYSSFRNSFHISYFVSETMKLFQDKIPNWLKRALSHNMDEMILEKKGVQSISHALLHMHSDYNSYDRTKTWKSLNVIIKLIFKFHGTEEFHSNILPQVVDIVKQVNEGKVSLIYEQVFILCLKYAYDTDRNLCETEFLPVLWKSVGDFSENVPFMSKQSVSTHISQIVRLIYCTFVLEDSDLPTKVLPIIMLENVVPVLFSFYCCIWKSNDVMFKNELKDILVKFLLDQGSINEVFDAFLFDYQLRNSLKQNKFITLEVVNTDIILHIHDNRVKVSLVANGDAVLDLLKEQNSLLYTLFVYLLDCISHKEKYFCVQNRNDLLDLENEFSIDIGLERQILVYNLLSTISEDHNVQKYIVQKPERVVSYFNTFLKNMIDKHIHKKNNSDCEDFHFSFTITMIIQAFTLQCNTDQLKEYEKLLPLLEIISCDTHNTELRQMCDNIIKHLENKEPVTSTSDGIKSEIDQALECLCDPLLPVRGHGILWIAKLLEKKDEEVLNRKHFILNLLEQHLKDEDSYIYLNAIRGLSALVEVFPDTVINSLCEEYSDFKRNDIDLRMKLGEILMRSTRNLGEKAQNHRAVLLNTFLAGTKDEDHLIRASSLSNLGEVCRVLSYKLGSILTEVLGCVHAVIATDKAVEARRAAVSVLRMLLAGLDTDMITFLKEDILDIYRTLKEIYCNDKDDIMRLHAQLAIEELNANMEKILIELPTLHFEKKPSVLK